MCYQRSLCSTAVQHERAPRSCVKRSQSSLLSGEPSLLPAGSMFPPFHHYASGPFPAFRPFPLVPPPFLGSYAGSAFTPIRPSAHLWPSHAELPSFPEPHPAEPPAVVLPEPHPGVTGRAPEATSGRPQEEEEVSSSQIDVVRVDSPAPERGDLTPIFSATRKK